MNLKDIIEWNEIAEKTAPDNVKEKDFKINLYKDLIKEEYEEFLKAIKENDEVEQFDACIDLVWVITGFMHVNDWPIDEGWKEVLKSNNSKFVNGEAIRHEKTGKIMKPESFVKPDLKSIIENKNRLQKRKERIDRILASAKSKMENENV